jgi:hypothetical protein
LHCVHYQNFRNSTSCTRFFIYARFQVLIRLYNNGHWNIIDWKFSQSIVVQ